MDASTVRMQLAEITTQLARNEEEHEVLASLQKGYEGWLRLHPESEEAQQRLPLPLHERRKRTQPKGSVSFRGSVLAILREARGQPLHVQEIYTRATARGALTAAKNPLGMVDLMALSLSRSHPIKKVGPRTWSYASDTNEDGTPM